MKKRGAVWVFLFASVLHAEEKVVRGAITYLAGGSVYTSLGRNAGVQDSTLLYVIAGRDTAATLKVFAVSSKSSVCWVVRSSRQVRVGDDVWGRIVMPEKNADMHDTVSSFVATGGSVPAPTRQQQKARSKPDAVQVQGRVSVQYFTSLYQNSAYNLAQPGVVLNLRGTMRDLPLRGEIYANLRTLGVGGQSPFSGRAINQSRIYGMSISYDDGSNVVSLGRIMPSFAPSIGYIDGVTASTKLGPIIVGAALGYQPEFSLRGLSSEYKKVALFAQVVGADQSRLSISTAYARTYYRSALDREAASMVLNASIANSFFVYGNVETDLRKKIGNELHLAPRLTSAYVNLSYRISGSFRIGVGADASRPYYSFQAIRDIADSLLVDELRSGMSLTFNWFLPAGIGIANTYSPRNAPNSAFGSEYANSSFLMFNDIFSSGITVRSNFNLHANRYTTASGYGVAVQRTFGEVFDVTARMQRSGYTIRQTDQREHSTTVGADVLLFLSSSLSLMTTFDRLEGYGSTSLSLFVELSMRF